MQSVIKTIDPQIQEFHKHREGSNPEVSFCMDIHWSSHPVGYPTMAGNTSSTSYVNTLCLSHFPESHWHCRSHDTLQKYALSFDGRNSKLTFQNENVWPFAIYPVTRSEKVLMTLHPSYLNLSPFTSLHICFIFLPIICKYSEINSNIYSIRI